MKLNKNITRLLTLSILFNNIYLSSNASTLSRYETLEGESVVLTDVDADDITEIEILGNTIQDTDNLEDIQSAGELYVDEKGVPILDNLGREQYKIEIDSYNQKTLLSKIEVSVRGAYGGSIVKTSELTGRFSMSNSSQDVGISFTNSSTLLGRDKWCYVVIKFDKDISGITFNLGRGYKIMPDNRTLIFNGLTYGGGSIGSVTINGKSGVELNEVYNYEIIEFIATDKQSDLTLWDSYKKYTTTILLPCQLMKIGDMSDKLFYDKNSGRYKIQKYIKETTLPSLGTVNSVLDNSAGGSKCSFTFYNVETWNNIFKGIGLKGATYWEALYHALWKPMMLIPGTTLQSHYCNTWLNNNYTGISKILSISNQSGGVVQVLFRDTDCSDTEQMNNWVESFSNKKVYYVLLEPELIETNIKNKINITIHPEKTYVYTESQNDINPTLKITVDRIEQVSQEAVKQAESNTTSSNIALARMFVNQLPDSLYKDQLQEKLNNLFSKDLVLDKYNSTANLDVYIKSENLLSMSLDTNSVVFDDYSGIDEIEKLGTINIAINSSLPYSLNAYIPNEIKNMSNTKTMDLGVLNIKESSESTYNTFNSINSKLILKGDCAKGNNKTHSIDLKLASDLVHEADVYKTVLKFEVEQK